MKTPSIQTSIIRLVIAIVFDFDHSVPTYKLRKNPTMLPKFIISRILKTQSSMKKFSIAEYILVTWMLIIVIIPADMK